MPTRSDNPLRPRLRKGREAQAKAPRGPLLRRLLRQATPRRPGWHRRSWRGVAVVPAGADAQPVVVKVQIRRPGMSGHTSWKAAVHQHLDYLQREGVALGGEAGQLYTRDAAGIEPSGFLGRAATDGHQFRVMVSAAQGADLDLTRFTRTFLGQVAEDLGTRLDWVAVNHYNTAHPHTHILVRGTDDQGQPLHIQRDYLAQGLRARAQELATRELGPRWERTPEREAAQARGQDVAPTRAVPSTPSATRDRGLDLDL